MKSISRTVTLVCLLVSFASFRSPHRSRFTEELRICEAVKKIMKAFEDGEIEKLTGGKIIMGDKTQWGSKITIKNFKDHYVYIDGPRSSFEATLNKKLTAENMNREMYYIASSLQTCLSISMKYSAADGEMMYEYATDDVNLLIWGKHVNRDDRSISIEIGYE
jgi:hypothetical protein